MCTNVRAHVKYLCVCEFVYAGTNEYKAIPTKRQILIRQEGEAMPISPTFPFLLRHANSKGKTDGT